MNTFKNFQIEVMLSKSLQGKAPLTWQRPEWRNFYRSLRLTRLSVHTLAAMIWQGYPFTPPYTSGRRLEENFCGAWHIAFDFDQNGASLDYLMRPDSMAWTFASFAYSTPSSTTDHPKSRVVFIFSEPIKTPEHFRLLHQAIAAEFELEGSHTDPACKDSLRLYYGSPNCQVVTNWSVLTPDTIGFLIERYQQEHLPSPEPIPDITSMAVEPSRGYIENRANALLEKVVLAPDGEKHSTLNKVAFTLGGMIGGGYIDYSDTIAKCEAAIVANGRADDLKAAKRTIEEAIEKGQAKPLVIERTYKRDLDELL